MKRVDVLEIMEQLRVIAEKAERLDLEEVSIGNRVLENRILVLQGYFNFLETTAIPIFEDILEQAKLMDQKSQLGVR